jgi:glycosyltransferase involved in cell wall biosynthesis
VSAGHLASNPRLVKEADALSEAGFAVRVVAGDVTPGVRPLDATILARASWPVVKVGLGTRPLYLARRLRQELTIRARGIGGVRAAQWALSPITGILARAAAAQRADLYIAHCLAALPAAAWAARRHGAKLGFDAEDDHVGELEGTPENQFEIENSGRIEAHYLPQCRHLTAASPGIARAYRERYGVKMTPILNVFPLSQAPTLALSDRPNKGSGLLSVYWFSQTIGDGRGLEPFIKAMGKLRGRVTLTIRGSDFLGYSTQLKALATDVGVADAIRFLPSAPPDQMAQLAAQHDVGLSLELSTPPSRAVCLTNKLFIYLLAGIPLLLSGTSAQRLFAANLGDAARVVDLSDSDAIVAAIDGWRMDSDALTAAKRQAWQLGQKRFNWDVEKESFLRLIKETLA